MNEKVFPAQLGALGEVTAFVESELERAECGMKAMMQLSVAVEEIFVNVAHYAYPDGAGDVTVGVSAGDGRAVVRFTDSGVPFDPLAREEPDITLPAEERPIGGLGILMVKKTMDSVNYVNQDGKNVLTLEKRF